MKLSIKLLKEQLDYAIHNLERTTNDYNYYQELSDDCKESIQGYKDRIEDLENTIKTLETLNEI